MPAEKMEPYNYRARPSMMKQVNAIAEKRGENVSELVRDGFKDYIRKYKHLLDAPPS